MTAAGAVTAKFYNQTYTTLDLSGLNQSYYYPVTSGIEHQGFNHIQVNVQLDSGTKPSWSTHVAGYTCNMNLYVVASGWGTTDAQSYSTDYSYKFADSNPCGYSQMINSNTVVLWLRGGGKYHVKTDCAMTWTIRTTTYTVSSQTVAPQTTNPGLQINKTTIHANLNGNATTATTLQRARTINVQDASATNTGTAASFNGGANAVIKLPSTIKANITVPDKLVMPVKTTNDTAAGSLWLRRDR